MKPAAALYFERVASLIALIFLGLAWELWLAPLRAGGSLLALKVLPLLLPLFGILRGKIYTYQWSAMLILAFFAEGAVRAWSDHGLSARLAPAETALTFVFSLAACCTCGPPRAKFDATPHSQRPHETMLLRRSVPYDSPKTCR